MEVHANIRCKVDVDPKDVIEKLIIEEICPRSWVFKEDDKYYIGYEESAGIHSIECKRETTQETYDYVIALNFILKQLEKK